MEASTSFFMGVAPLLPLCHFRFLPHCILIRILMCYLYNRNFSNCAISDLNCTVYLYAYLYVLLIQRWKMTFCKIVYLCVFMHTYVLLIYTRNFGNHLVKKKKMPRFRIHNLCITYVSKSMKKKTKKKGTYK